MKHLLYPLRRALARTLLTASLLLALAGAGCGTVGGSGSGSADFASVTITSHSAEQIVQTTAAVFGTDGFVGGMSGDGQMTFEKAASGLTTLSRDGLVAAQSGARTINRVRVQILTVGGGTYRLQCQAFLVSGGSDPFFQNESALSSLRSGPYQSLLNKVAKQLKKMPPTAAPAPTP
jgi:hypothetical protein